MLLPLLLLLAASPAAGLVLIDEPATRQVLGAEDGWLLWVEAAEGGSLRLRHVEALDTPHAVEALAGDDLVRVAMGAGHVALVTADPATSGPQRPKDLWVVAIDGGSPERVVEGAAFLDGPRGDEQALVWSTFPDNRSLIHRLDTNGAQRTFDVSQAACLLPQAWPAGSLVTWRQPTVAGCPRTGFQAFDVSRPETIATVPVEGIALNTGGGWISFVGFDINEDGWYLFGADNLTGGPWKVVPTSIRPIWGQADGDRFVWLENPEEHPPADRPYRIAGVGQRMLPGGEPGFLGREIHYQTLPVLDGDRLYYNSANGTLEAFELDTGARPGGGRGLPGPGVALMVAGLLVLALMGRRGRCASQRS